MKKFFSLATLVLAVCVFSGCLQSDKLVKVNPDGSGTVEDTLILGKQSVAQMKQMAEGFGALGQPAGKAPAPFKVLDEAKLRETAEKMGDGVTFVSAKPVENAFGEGYTAIYAFTDINNLKLDQNPTESLPMGNPAMKMAKAKREAVKFEFKKGAHSFLTVKLPQPKDGDLPKQRPPMPQMPAGGGDMAGMMMQQMFKDLKMTVAVEVQGRIVETNAEYQNGSRVTLMEMDFNKVLANPEKFKALTQAQPKTVEEAKALAKGIDGIKAETQPTVMVEFQ